MTSDLRTRLALSPWYWVALAALAVFGCVFAWSVHPMKALDWVRALVLTGAVPALLIMAVTMPKVLARRLAAREPAERPGEAGSSRSRRRGR